MGCVPLVFRESVCASLNWASLCKLSSLEPAGYVGDDAQWRPFAAPWTKVALDVESRTKHVELDVIFDGNDEVFYKTLSSVEEVKKAKYVVWTVAVSSRNVGDIAKKGSLRALLHGTNFQALHLNSATYFDNFMDLLRPGYLRTVSISCSKFKSASTLSVWLKKAMQHKSLNCFSVKSTSVDDEAPKVEDFQEHLYSLLVHSRHLSYVSVHNNDSIADLDLSFVVKLWKHWLNAQEGFQRRVVFSCRLKHTDEEEELMRRYEFEHWKVFHHKSGRGRAKIFNTRGVFDVEFS
uniref:FBA_2 domain-containing protein n=1 Tax=Steinernema glaseri TaxID=37863 RepID=A0A1I8AED3_9BILA